MTNTQRDMQDYTIQYRELPFEHIQAAYRRKTVLEQILRYSPIRLLEVGCGEHPLFTDLPNTECVVLEPASEFAANARALGSGLSNLTVHQCFVEDFSPEAVNFDFIVVSCVLHEVPDASAMLAALRRLCNPSTTVHFNVPNAYSLHRRLAVAMGLLAAPTETSDTQLIMQQRGTPYTLASLKSDLSQNGFSVLDEGSIFVKPFTHAQMQHLVDSGFMTSTMLDGLQYLAQTLPDLGSEIWVNATLATA